MKHIPSNILVPSVLYMVYLVFLLQILFLPLLFIFFFFFRPTLFNKSLSMDSVKLTQLNSSLVSLQQLAMHLASFDGNKFLRNVKEKSLVSNYFFLPPRKGAVGSRFGSCNQANVCVQSRKNDCAYCAQNDWSGNRKKGWFVWE